MTRFNRYALTSAELNACNALDGIENYANLDTAFVQTTNHWYRFFAASTVAPNGVTVIAPANITPPDPGRWIRQGIPALVGNRTQFPSANTDPCVPAFGEGAQLRMVDAHLASASGVVLSTGAVGPTVASMPDPSPTRRYWAKALFGLQATGGAGASIDLFPSFSYDGGGVWTPVGSAQRTIIAPFNANQSMLAEAILPLTLGSALPGAGVTAGDTELQFRIEAEVSAGAASTNGSMTLQLFETL